MINSYFKSTTASRNTYSPYFANRAVSDNAIKANNQHKNRKYKLIIILLTKATHRELRLNWNQLWAPQREMTKAITKIIGHSDKNMTLSVYLSFDRLKKAAVQQKSGERLIKNTVVLLQRIEKFKLKQCFGKLALFTARQNETMLCTFFERRDFQFCRKMQTMIRHHKKDGLTSMFRYAKFVKSFCKVRVMAVIHSRLQKHIKHQAFTRLMRFQLSRGNGGKEIKEMKDLKVQISDMSVQLENKNDNISRLEGELHQIKIEQSSIVAAHNMTYGEQANRSGRESYKNMSMNKKLSRNHSENRSNFNDSGDNLLSDMSIGSLLGNLNRSRYGSISKYDPNCECNCGLKSKYIKYKTLNESLKNQLEIVKEELEVAKDLNEHFTN